MGPPTHLWSGDWRRESEAHPPDAPPASAPREALEPPETERPGPPRRTGEVRVDARLKKPSRRTMIAAATAMVVVLAIGVPLATLGDSSPSPQPTTPTVQAPVQPGNYQSGNGVYTIPQAIPAPTTPHRHTGP